MGIVSEALPKPCVPQHSHSTGLRLFGLGVAQRIENTERKHVILCEKTTMTKIRVCNKIANFVPQTDFVAQPNFNRKTTHFVAQTDLGLLRTENR